MNGGKYIKLGDDKRQVTIIPNTDQQLYNISSGKPLTDEFGNQIVTEVDTFYVQDATQDRSTSIVFSTKIGNYSKFQISTVAITTANYSSSNTNIVGIDTANISVGDIIIGRFIPEATIISRIGIGSIYISNFSKNKSTDTEIVEVKRKIKTVSKSNPTWKIAEQFPQTSQVSTTLLGVNRGERQLSLFANVSSYGLDKDDFEYYTNNSSGGFSSWETRENKIYGFRYTGKITEETQESGIKITAFPTPYTYPYGPKFTQVGFYNATLFGQYRNFIDAGNQLYDYYNTGIGSDYPSYWKEKFLPRSIATLDGGDDVRYVAGFTTAFAKIDTWTETWKDIVDGKLNDPITGEIFGENEIQTIIPTYTNQSSRPGYSNSEQRYVYLQSRKTFRYQPGRISGFTFGVRATPVLVSGIALEWGITNPTDQYVFRVDASNSFSIVRRSTIPLEESVLTRNGLNETDQIKTTTGDPYDLKEYWTIAISKDKFNGDPLNGNGESGYTLNLDNVTMYKIEFGWYGAIGARFYAYIPTNNGEARWVVLHTLVIENYLGSPCLQDSYFRLKYSLNITNTRDVRIPYYVYKYGASYYIDGGDEGTSQIYSVGSKQVGISTDQVKTLIGIQPKEYIYNSNGVPIENKKLIIPTELNLTSDSLAEVKVVTCSACPGFGHVYTPGLATTENGRYVDIQFLNSNTIEAINTSYFTVNDIGAKIIAPSIYNAYIYNVLNPDSTGIGQSAVLRGYNNENLIFAGSSVLDRVTGITTIIEIGAYPYPIRLSNYDSYAASDFAFTGSKIEIQFVNPNINDNYAHFADFLIGVTDKTPDVSDPDILNGFIISGITTTILPITNILYGEHSLSNLGLNEDGVQTSEVWSRNQPPLRMAIDNRIPKLLNPAGGTCSKVTVTVLNPIGINDIREYNVNPDTNLNDGKSYIQIQGQFPSYNYDGGQVATQTGNNITVYNSYFSGQVNIYTKTVSGVSTQYSYIQISQPLGLIPSGSTSSSPFTLSLRPINIYSEFGVINSTKIFNYNPYPLYVVAKLRDYAQINNISIKETIGDNQRTISPKWYSYENTTVTDADGKAIKLGFPPTDFKDVYNSSSALIDTQNQQQLRPYIEKDTVYVGQNSTNRIDMKKIFGVDRTVITPDNNNLEATFIVAKKIDGGNSGVIQVNLNYKEQ